MKWRIQTPHTSPQSDPASIRSIILNNRHITDIDSFLNPPDPLTITPASVGIDQSQLQASISLIQQARDHKTPILIYGDYDADGITATAILWETLHKQGHIAIPFIPHRQDHGYGLSPAGLEAALATVPQNQKPLIITVDNGISAHQAADICRQRKIDLIITDHHQQGKTLPFHTHLIHTDTIAGSAVSWFLAKEISLKAARDTLDLVSIGTVADMLPLIGPNRAIVKAGLQALPLTKRVGLQTLYQLAGVDTSLDFSTYHINYIIAPRLNAMGRLSDAMDSLRLLVTNSSSRAQSLSSVLHQTNSHRQELTQAYIDLAESMVGTPQDHLIVIDHPEFHEGIVGLVAGKLVERYYRPAIVLTTSGDISKASARSVPGVDIIQLIRQHQDLLLNAGGHPMAAGFSIQTSKISTFKSTITTTANATISSELLTPSLDIDCILDPAAITVDLYQIIETLKPFGMQNPRPVFASYDLRLTSAYSIGKNRTHLKLIVSHKSKNLDCIGFNLALLYPRIADQTTVSLAYTIDENVWNGRRSLQLQIKDIR